MRGLHWFRNDLRLQDNRALGDLFQAVDEWCGLFVLEPRLVNKPSVSRKRLSFLFGCLDDLASDIAEVGSRLVIVEGPAETQIPQVMHELSISVLSFNEGTTPFARSRDQSVIRSVEKAGHQVLKRRDHVIFSATDIRSSKGSAYSVYTPYRNAWWKKYSQSDHGDFTASKRPGPIANFGTVSTPRLFIKLKKNLEKPTFKGGYRAANNRLNQFLNKPVAHYHQNRDRPDLDGTSRLSMHLRFGTLSVRECFKQALEASHSDPSYKSGVQRWLDELVWREFYNAILEENPRVLHSNYRQEYDYLNWRNNPKDFSAWCTGRTGFPIVDAGIRQLLSTGWMHNRARMIVASFLTKDLLIRIMYMKLKIGQLELLLFLLMATRPVIMGVGNGLPRLEQMLNHTFGSLILGNSPNVGIQKVTIFVTGLPNLEMYLRHSFILPHLQRNWRQTIRLL